MHRFFALNKTKQENNPAQPPEWRRLENSWTEKTCSLLVTILRLNKQKNTTCSVPKKSTPNQTKHDMFFTNKQDQHQQKTQHQSNLTKKTPLSSKKNKAQSIRGSFFKANTWDRVVTVGTNPSTWYEIKHFFRGDTGYVVGKLGECRIEKLRVGSSFQCFLSSKSSKNELRKTHRRLPMFLFVSPNSFNRRPQAPFKRLRADSACKVSSADETLAHFFRRDLDGLLGHVFNGQLKRVPLKKKEISRNVFFQKGGNFLRNN